MGKINTPKLLGPQHETAQFCSGNETLDEWLIKRAWKNQQNGASRTFVICQRKQVVGYYALATGSIERTASAGNFARSMPNPIPVIILGRLAIDVDYQSQRLGAALLKDAMLRTLSISENVGIRGLLVHAISEAAKQFYLGYGFQISPTDSMTLLLSMNSIRAHIGN